MSDISLSPADLEAIASHNCSHFVDKGAKYYVDRDFEHAIEYYRIASAMGDDQATSNLGYCYLYGRSIESNIDLAIAYFKIAAEAGNIDAIYKLGKIYADDEFTTPDKELSLFYYRRLAERIEEIAYHVDTQTSKRFASVFLALAKEYLPEGGFRPDLSTAFEYLQYAKTGFKASIDEGVDTYIAHFEETKKLLENPIFDDLREENNLED